MPRGNNAPGKGALVVRSGAVVVSMISGEAPTTNLPQGAVIFIVVGGVLVAFEIVGEWGGGARDLALVSGQVVNASLWYSTTLEAVSSIL